VLPDHEPELESEPEPQEDESETDAESDIIEEENDAVIPSVDREINLRDAGADDSNQDGEISLH